MNKSAQRFIFYPLVLAVVLIAGIFIGQQLGFYRKMNGMFLTVQKNKSGKINEVLNYIQEEYVDTINPDQLSDKALQALLENLDPHSSYIPASDLAEINESLDGNFDGVGIEFNVLEDTIVVVAAVSGGPSDQLGIKSGDRIVSIEGKNVAGIKIKNEDIIAKLRGKKGSKVKVGIARRGIKKPMEFVITRDAIPLYSVDAGFMLNNETGYIKISKFAAKTYQEYLSAYQQLKGQGMQNLVLDLRGNPGGYLTAATKIADEFLTAGKMVVYTQGKSRSREEFKATSEGQFENGKLVVLIDEGSASASEIIAGAIQDNDRGVIIGRRSFGKGLVQEQSEFGDGSAIRLTIARYYTPSGRCIQKPYEKGKLEEYYQEEHARYKNGELYSKDSIKFDEKQRFKTLKGRTVYGGGGIMPDVFIPLDTTGRDPYFTELLYKGVINDFALDFADRNRSSFSSLKTVQEFVQKINFGEKELTELAQFAARKEVKSKPSVNPQVRQNISLQLKALVARVLYKNQAFYYVILERDNALKEALKEFSK